MILNPYRHSDSTHLFCEFYKINLNSPDLESLHAILRNFSNIPYENISKIIIFNEHSDNNDKYRLPEAVISDHISFKLGGTCFSLTYFLQTILTNSGFSCYPVMADMKAGENIHCFLIVILNGKKFLVDPAYLLKDPMEFNMEKPYLYWTEHTGVRIEFDISSHTYNLFTFNKNTAKWRYRFRDRPTPSEEFLFHWNESFYKNSMNAICLTKTNENEIIYIRKYFLRKTGMSEKKNFNIRNNYHDVVHEIFGIDKTFIEKAMFALKNRKISCKVRKA